MIEMNDISKRYRSGLFETVALHRLSLKVARGEFLAVLGPSGSGKTTLLNAIGLLDPVDEGTYRLDGVDVATLDDAAASRLRAEKIGFVFQRFNLLPDLSVRDNVALPLRYRGIPRKAQRQRVEVALERVGMMARADHLPGSLSGGQQQRVAVARALVGRPALVLADEPTGNLDSVNARRILDLLQDIHAEGATVVMVTHDPGLAVRATRRVHLLDGRVIEGVADGPAPSEASSWR
ncbi:MAG: ABC transporter ATP-binding protein [Deltaproteobacteria bacterium]|nr:MAG: ABC transporter ATP-binding protein [Deltaproteobacteria bacterium]